MIDLIPRLVLDEDEVSKIIHDVYDDEVQACRYKSEQEINEHEQNNDGRDSGSIGTQSSSSKRASDGKNTITSCIAYTVNTIKDLPHRATFQWRHLLGILAVMILSPLLGEVVFVLPMNSVNSGPDENQVFIYGIMTLYQFFVQLPWVETCNFAMPQVSIPIRGRLVALLAGLTIAKLIDLILTMGIFTYEPVFPLPFSILITGTVGILPAVPILYLMTPRKERLLGNFSQLFTLLVAYWVALAVVIGWAIGIQRLQGKSLQYVVLFSYAALRFACKVLLCANVSTRLQPKRHIQLNLVVDILFTRVQVATWPFVDSPSTLMALFASESSVILWRYYNGVDRIQLWFRAIMTTASLDKNQDDNISKRRRMKGITEACFKASNQYIINMTLSEDKNDVIRNLTSLSLSQSSSTLSNDMEAFCDNDESLLEIAVNEKTQPKTQTHNRINICGNNGTAFEIPCNCCTEKLDDGNWCIESLPTIRNATVLFEGGEGSTYDISYQGSAPHIRSDDIESQLFHDEIEDDDISIVLTAERNGLAGILRRPIRENSSKSVAASGDVGDVGDVGKLVDVDLGEPYESSLPPTPEETWEQRDLYHMVDSTGSLCINIIVRINQQLIFVAVRNLPSSAHLNESFQISDERWQEAQIYGSIYITLMFLLVIGINFSPVFFSKKKGLEGKKLSLGRVLSYLFKEHFWFFFFWLISTGALVSSAMVNHFGADFSMNFEYLSCLEKIEWPRCPVVPS